MLDLSQIMVTRFPDVLSKQGREVSLAEIVEEIREPSPQTLDTLERMGGADNEEAEKLKKALPAVTFAGTFPDGRAKDKLGKASHLVVLDFDTHKATYPDTARGDVLRRLADDPHLVLRFTSPRGGVKAVFLADGVANDDDFKAAFSTLKERYPEADDSGKDLSRLCFLPHDSELVVNTEAKALAIRRADLFQAQHEPAKGVESTPLPSNAHTASEAERHVRNIFRQGERLKLVSPETSRHSYMLSATLTAWRYVLGGHLEETEALEICRNEYGQLFRGDPERMRDVERAFKEGRAHAEAKGALHPTIGKAAPPATAEEVPEDVLASVWVDVFTPSWSNEPAYVEPVFRFLGVDVGQVGSLTVVKAKPKSGKTTVALAMWTAYYTHERAGDVDTFGFTVTPPNGREMCLYFDSEQGNLESWQAWARALRRVNISGPSDAPVNAENTLLCLTGITDNVIRQALLFQLVEMNAEYLGAIIVDGVADFVKDVNDSQEVDTFMQKLRKLADKHRVCVVATIHENPGTDKARGHLGSDLSRRAGATLRLEKDRKTGIHTLSIAENRRGADGLSKCFRWDDDLGRHVSISAPPPVADKVKPILDGLRGQEVRRDVLIAKLELAGSTKGAAAKTVQRLAKDGHIYHVKRGLYRIPAEENLFPEEEES